MDFLIDIDDHFCLCLPIFREEAIEAAPTNVTVSPGAPAVLSCRTHLALHGHMSWVRIYPETGRVEELANSTEVYRQVTCRKEHIGGDLQRRPGRALKETYQQPCRAM